MKCVICHSSRFSYRASDLSKPEPERYRQYGDCCCLSCAVKKQSILEEAYPDLYKEVILKMPDGEEYILKTYVGPPNTAPLLSGRTHQPVCLSKGHVGAIEQ